MPEKMDFKILKIFPFIFSACISCVVLCTAMLCIYGKFSGFFLTVELFRYILILSVFFCLYRLSDMFKTLVYADIFYTCFFLAEITDKCLLGLYRFVGDDNVLVLFCRIAESIPDIFVMLGGSAVIMGFYHGYVQMKEDAAASKLKIINYLWIISEILGIIISDVLFPLFRYYNVDLKVIFFAIMLPVLIFCVVVAVIISVNTRNFCYSYYLYAYNRAITEVK
ncbi:MAG: hypothetical protein K6F77_08695 [Lachnospiraceae bacterium]|nr:hypothetical protein [Lachnospiraceae bacterium]